MFNEEIELAIQAEAIARFPLEACGVVLARGFVPLRNMAANPEEEFDCADDVAQMMVEGEPILALVHSHIHRPPARPANEGPSEADMRQQEAMGIPWGIVCTDGGMCQPTFYWGEGVPIPPLEGRMFRHGPSGSDHKGDCYALIRDYYLQELGIALPAGYRDPSWWTAGQDLYRANFAGAGFRQIAIEDLAVGDVMLAHVLSDRVNHGGIYVGDGLILHHLTHRLSRREPFGRWRNLITHVLRHEQMDARLTAAMFPAPAPVPDPATPAT